MKDLISILISYGIDAYITPMQDEHLNEFISENDNYVKFLTGFSGSSGTAITSAKFKGLLTDGRYYNQSLKQLTDYELVKSSESSIEAISEAKSFKKVGIDPHFISYAKYLNLKKGLGAKGIELVDTENLMEIVWSGKKERKFKPLIDLENFEYIAEPRFYDIIRALNNEQRAKLSEKQSSHLLETSNIEKENNFNNMIFLNNVVASKSVNLPDSKNNANLNSFYDPDIFLDKYLVSKIYYRRNEKDLLTGKQVKKSADLSSRLPRLVKNKQYELFSLGKKPLNITGTTRKEKIEKILQKIEKDEVLLVTELDTIAWIFNLRGSDVEHNMFFYSYAVLSHEKIILFLGRNIYLEGVEIRKYYLFDEFIPTLQDKKVVVSSMVNAYIGKRLKRLRFATFVSEMQSIKNEYELYGVLEANIIDAIALIKSYELITYSSRNYTETEISKTIDQIKNENQNFLFPSFKNIVGAGENSADMHHDTGSKVMSSRDMILIDSGSQYIFGTTDITRTLSRRPTEEMKEKYTVVLKANLAAKMVNSKNITGDDIDSAARNMTKSFGFDFDSSTGHGIGVGLNVHEHPPNIGKNGGRILKNQIFSIEPGFYQKEKFGVRIEDAVFLDDSGKIRELTYLPYHMDLIDVSKLNSREKLYLNEYNRKIRLIFSPLLGDGPGSKYLMDNTKTLD